jgi:hypothetical protein
MLAHLAIHTPKPERIDDLIASMQRFAATGRSQAGLQEVHTMRDAESGKLLGLAICGNPARPSIRASKRCARPSRTTRF